MGSRRRIGAPLRVFFSGGTALAPAATFDVKDRLVDYEGRKFVSTQSADVKLNEYEAEKKCFRKLKDMYRLLTDWTRDFEMNFNRIAPLDNEDLMQQTIRDLEMNFNKIAPFDKKDLLLQITRDLGMTFTKIAPLDKEDLMQQPTRDL